MVPLNMNVRSWPCSHPDVNRTWRRWYAVRRRPCLVLSNWHAHDSPVWPTEGKSMPGFNLSTCQLFWQRGNWTAWMETERWHPAVNVSMPNCSHSHLCKKYTRSVSLSDDSHLPVWSSFCATPAQVFQFKSSVKHFFVSAVI